MAVIKKIVIPVAGYGTRFLPFTKSIPKEMLPIVDRPIIQYIVEQAVEAGIEEVILITGYSKRAIEDYFDYNLELEYLLEKSGKTAQRELIRDISDIAKFVYIRQKEQLGTGHALLQAREVINGEPFMVVCGDDLFMGRPSNIQLLANAYEKYQAPVMLVMHKDKPEDYDRHGYIDIGKELGNGMYEVKDLVEKPGAGKSPSTLASLMSHVLTSDIFPILDKQKPNKGGEIVLAEAIGTLSHQQKVVAIESDELKYFDCGNKLEYMKAVVEFGLARPDLGKDFRSYLQSLNL